MAEAAVFSVSRLWLADPPHTSNDVDPRPRSVWRCAGWPVCLGHPGFRSGQLCPFPVFLISMCFSGVSDSDTGTVTVKIPSV